MANTSPPRQIIKGSLRAIISLVEHKDSSDQWEPIEQKDLSIISIGKKMPADVSDGYITHEFQVEANARGRYDVDFELKNKSTGDVRCSVRNTLIFKSKLWPF